MKRIEYFACFIFLLILFISCSEKKQSVTFAKQIQINDFQHKTVDLNNVVSGIKILPLKTSDNNLLGNVKDLCVIDDVVYVLDDLTFSIFSFDINTGNLIKKVTNKGVGPNEYVHPIAMTCDDNKVYILDLPMKKIISFDECLNPLKTIDISFSASDFIALDNGFLLHNLDASPGNFNFVHIDKKGRILDGCLPFFEENPSEYNGAGGKYFSQNDTSIYFSKAYSNEIYSFEKDKFKSAYKVDFGDLSIPKELNTNNMNLFEEPYALNMNFFVLPNGFVHSFIYKSQRYYGFVDKMMGNKQFGVVTDEKNALPFFPRWQHKNSLIGTCYFESIKNIVKQDGLEDETPVLLFYTFE